jgi:hypothetical protein
MTPDKRERKNRDTKVRHRAARLGYAVSKAPGSGLYRLLYVAAGKPYRPVLAGALETIEERVNDMWWRSGRPV